MNKNEEARDLCRAEKKGIAAGRTPPCVLCGTEVLGATFHDFKFDEARTLIDWPVCPNHVVPFATRNLAPCHVLRLREIAGGDTFLTHGDFYDERGNSLQPIGRGRRRAQRSASSASFKTRRQATMRYQFPCVIFVDPGPGMEIIDNEQTHSAVITDVLDAIDEACASIECMLANSEQNDSGRRWYFTINVLRQPGATLKPAVGPSKGVQS